MIRVVTFNTLGYSKDCASDTNERKAEIIKALEDEMVDVALLQEIKTIYPDDDNPGHDTEIYIRKSKIFRNNTRIVYGDQRPHSKEGIGILSRLNIIDELYGPLPQGLFGRSYLILLIENHNKQRFYIMTFHLAAPAIGRMVTQYGATKESQDEARKKQLNKISELVNNLEPDLPLIIGGDFNLDSSEKEYISWRDNLHLTEVWPDTGDNVRKTFATHKSSSFDYDLEFRLDHLLFRNGRKKKIILKDEGCIFNTPKYDEKYFFNFLSDHMGLYLDFELI